MRTPLEAFMSQAIRLCVMRGLNPYSVPTYIPRNADQLINVRWQVEALELRDHVERQQALLLPELQIDPTAKITPAPTFLTAEQASDAVHSERLRECEKLLRQNSDKSGEP